MTAADLLTKLQARKVRIDAIGGRLRIDAPKGVVTADLLQVLAEHKTEIMARIQGKPYLTARAELVIPLDAAPRYRWWQEGQSVAETLRELDAPLEVWRLYTDEPYPHGGFVAEVEHKRSERKS